MKRIYRPFTPGFEDRFFFHRRRKLPATVLLKALGYTTEELLAMYYEVESVFIEKDDYFRSLNLDNLSGQRATSDISDPKTGEVIVKKGRRVTKAAIKTMQDLKVKKFYNILPAFINLL